MTIDLYSSNISKAFMSTVDDFAYIISNMAAAVEFLSNKSILSQDESDTLYICNESFKALEPLISLFLKYSANLDLPRGNNYTHSEALAFGAALEQSHIFGQSHHQIAPELEHAQVEEFKSMMDCLNDK